MTYVQVISVQVVGTTLRFERRPVSSPPKDGAVALIDWGDKNKVRRRKGGFYKDGAWRASQHGRPFDPQPTHWTDMQEPKRDAD